jgi:hypothetical protein
VHVIATANRKGGSGKTTTAFNLTGALSERGFRVLAVDLGPQDSLSRQGFGVESGELTLSQVFDRRGEGFSHLFPCAPPVTAPPDSHVQALRRRRGDCAGKRHFVASLGAIRRVVGDRSSGISQACLWSWRTQVRLGDQSITSVACDGTAGLR